MKTWLLLCLLVVLGYNATAQATIAKLKYEEAEEAFVANDYLTTISKLDETEKLLGATNPRILYLRIMAQDKLIRSELFLDYEIIAAFRKNCSTYLTKYESVSGIEEKYKEVYKASETYKLIDIPEQALANLAKATATTADYAQLGDAYYRSGNYKAAAGYLKTAAAKGNAFANALLGYMTQMGWGVTKDSAAGNRLIEKAMAANHPDAFHTRAFSYRGGIDGMPKDSLMAVEYFKKSYQAAFPLADKGNPEYLFYAGRALMDAEGADTLNGVELITKAAGKGNIDALIKLGECYRDGLYVDQDYTKAMQFFQKAAAKGSATGMYRVGGMYFRGNGVSQDYGKALDWYEKACIAGNIYAPYSIGYLYAEGLGVTKDCPKAITWYELSGKRGYFSAYNIIGNTYYWGNCVTKDYNKAAIYYTKAAENDVIAAMNNLANVYYAGGNGLTQNYPKAAEWYLKGAAKNYAWCMYNYGNMLYNGNGMAVDYLKAIEWYKKAADLDNTDAMDKLYSMYYNGIGVKKDKKTGEQWAARSAALKAKKG
ncbi:tetratricopeptide repeat protein [Filimonas effusa]|uniref:Sel1 repeat family protein n=1 Tax=Filimonas effusa TaxID=2508721 RepID=A0A4Q1D922_9BACT|nr:tetratricopeptide repeat protein [Filimonas effusa]RXK85308.1 sel1 repeat family protein [Filimonas effusa]